MKILYDKYRKKSVKYEGGIEGIIVGFCDNNLIATCEEGCNPSYSFRRLDKNTFIDEKYRDSKYRYFYVTESTMLKQHPKIK
ncbi:MAG TPA: hypothetical protein VLA48_02595 [Nitrososphaeraceae archaeon]|nr:hypothetical protein [Nitrososphaeraceae archaeon]